MTERGFGCQLCGEVFRDAKASDEIMTHLLSYHRISDERMDFQLYRALAIIVVKQEKE